ncbi:hypothetical protein BDW62DRAFT_106884 [Aspergillus aurantiobrunneus]
MCILQLQDCGTIDNLNSSFPKKVSVSAPYCRASHIIVKYNKLEIDTQIDTQLPPAHLYIEISSENYNWLNNSTCVGVCGGYNLI